MIITIPFRFLKVAFMPLKIEKAQTYVKVKTSF